MTEKEKALGYLQMLKNEGKLDENAIDELTGMYGIPHKEAEALLHSFKQTDTYEKGAAKNITYYILLSLVMTIVAAIFGYMAFSRTGSSAFLLHFIIAFVSAIGATTYLARLIAERYRLEERYTWLKNKALAPLLFTLPLLLYFQYGLSEKTFLARPREWVQLPPGILAEDCHEHSTGGKNPTHYYTLHTGYYLEAFEYRSEQHQYCLTRNPEGLLKKGDTVTLWVEQNSEPSLQHSTDNKVWDIGYKGERLLDVDCRNRKAGEAAERTRDMMALISGASLAAFVYYQVQLSKKPVT